MALVGSGAIRTARGIYMGGHSMEMKRGGRTSLGI